MNAYLKCVAQFQKIYQLNHAMAILSWDEAVMMPSKSGHARAESLATLKSMEHSLVVEPQLQDWLASAAQQTEQLDRWQQRNLQLMHKRYQDATCLDNEFVEKYSHATINCEQAWRVMRADNDWQSFKPLLEEVVNLTREKAERRAAHMNCSAYDALIDEYSPGLSQAFIDPLFQPLRAYLPEKVAAVVEGQPNLVPFEGEFSVEKQRQLGKSLMALLGFDFDRGRLDVSHHPFCGGVPEDVRITTRYQTHEFISSVMGVCHETGHALYEFGLPSAYKGMLVGSSYGMSIHESQSLFIEMQICRSRPFMALLQNKLAQVFGDQAAFELDNLYNHYTHVAKGYIRVDADELTYPLHIILRYELEQQLIAGDISVADLPELWDQKMQQYLHLSTKGNDKDGVMQDVHWPSGAFGYFPAYTLGAMIAAQLAESMYAELPDLRQSIDQQSLAQVKAWLGQAVHQWGAFHSVDELMQSATGNVLSAEPFMRHLANRYG